MIFKFIHLIVKRICFPLIDIVLDILPNAAQFQITPDYMLPIIPLPDNSNVCIVTKPFSDTYFETSNNGPNRFRDYVLVLVM
jgi:hypothetical protein